MTQAKLIDALRYIAAFYDLYFPSISEECFMPMHMSNLATIMWVREYPDDIYSNRIREQMNILWTQGKLIFDE